MTKNELIRLAYNRLGMGVDGVPITPGQYELAETVLDAGFAEINTEASAYFDLSDIPAEAVFPMADFIAASVAPSFTMAAPRSRASAKLAVLAIIRPDDRKEVAQPEFY